MSDYDRSIHSNPDARAWARFFMETYNRQQFAAPDEGMMAGWFANAMMAMHDHLVASPADQRSLRERIHGTPEIYVASPAPSPSQTEAPVERCLACMRARSDHGHQPHEFMSNLLPAGFPKGWDVIEAEVRDLIEALEGQIAHQGIAPLTVPAPSPKVLQAKREPGRCGAWRINAERLAYACRLPAGHEGDHHPNPCGHDGCTGLECARAPSPKEEHDYE